MMRAFAKMGESDSVVNQEFHISIIYKSENQKESKYTAIEMVK